MENIKPVNTIEKTLTFHVGGMHCNACILLTESELLDVPYISRAKSSLKKNEVIITGNFGEKSDETIVKELTDVLTKHGYALYTDKQAKEKNWSEFKWAFPIAFAFAVLFVVLQKVGIVNLVTASKVTYGTAFVLGVVASLSTCMAVVGGLLLSMSATFAKEGDKVKPQLLFHAGRLVSFFVLGGIIGALGSVFQLSSTATLALGVLIALVMLILGINLLDVFHSTQKFQLGIPKFISRYALDVSKWNHSLTPLLVGIVTFFLPCGFTQSMQIYTLSTGSFMKGGLTMLSFALGTLPILALISFSSFSVRKSSRSGIFFKSAGLIVIMFAIFNLINSLVAAGFIPPLFSF